MGRSIGRSINKDRKAVAARRSAARQARLDLLRKVRDNPKADPEKRAAARSALRRAAARDAARAGIRSIGRAIGSGVRSMPEGYRSGAEQARQKRARSRAARGVPQGWVPAAPTTTPAAGGKDTPTSKENPVADSTTIKTTELATTEDLRQEIAAAETEVEAFAAQVKALNDWATGLVDRYAAANWGAKDITTAVALVADSAPDLKVAAALEAALTHLRKAVDAADVVAEAREAVQAEGDVQAFEPA
jgi:hypothetical protein